MTTQTRSAENIRADITAAHSRGDQAKLRQFQAEYRRSVPAVRVTNLPVELREGPSRVRSSANATTTSTRSSTTTLTPPKLFSSTRSLPPISGTPVGWATWSWSAYACIRDALEGGFIGSGIEGAGGLFGSVASDGAVRVERATENPRSTRASAWATRIDWDEIARHEEDLIFNGLAWQPIGTWHSHENWEENVRPSPADVGLWANTARSYGRPCLGVIVSPSSREMHYFAKETLPGSQIWSPTRISTWVVPASADVVWPCRQAAERHPDHEFAVMPRLD